MSTSGPITGFPAEGLAPPKRFITTHDAEGKSVFLPTDSGDHQAIMVEGAASQSIMYTADKVPANLNDEADVKWAKDNQVRNPPKSQPTLRLSYVYEAY